MGLMYHFDQLAAYDRQMGHTDALGLNAFFSNQLEQIRPQLYQKRYPELKARRFIPIKNDIHPGAMSLTERGVDEVGEAEFLSDLADDAPMVEVVKDKEDTYYMRGIALAYGWSLQEARNSQFAGANLDTRKAMACRRGIERFIDKNLLIGATVGGRTMYGLFALSGGVAPNTYTHDLVGEFRDQSSDDLYRNLMRAAMYATTQTNEIETVDSMIVAPTVKAVLSEKRMGDGNQSSVLAHFLASQDMIKSVETSHYLEPSGGYGGGASASRIVMYRNDAEVLEGLVNEFEQLPPEYKSMRVMTTCIARVGGCRVRLPKAITYVNLTHSGLA